MAARRPALLLVSFALLAALVTRPVAADDLAALARGLGADARLRVVAHAGWAPAEELTLDLGRFEAVVPGARLTLHGQDGESVRPLPATVHLRGRAEPGGARVALAVREDGELRALLADGDGLALARARDGQPLVFARVAPDAAVAPFTCGAEGLEGPDGAVETIEPLVAALGSPELAGHTARVALESDYEYYQRFGNATAASEYALDLVAFASTIYEAELGTSLAVASVSLWTTASDPWTQGNSLCALYQFGAEWNADHAGEERTIAHFLSGKSTGGGVAWVGVLCSGAFTVSGVSCAGMASSGSYGGGYGYTGNLSGSFDPGDPQPGWDIIAVAHEIGHNFGSPHTHCYAGYGGVSDHVDQCASSTSSGCYAGTVKTLPGVDSVTGGSAGQRNGTLMSYCHLLSGGYNNIELGFGLDHPYGVAAERVPQRMAAHVASRAAAFPTCLAPLAAGAIFSDDFESGALTAWDQ